MRYPAGLAALGRCDPDRVSFHDAPRRGVDGMEPIMVADSRKRDRVVHRARLLLNESGLMVPRRADLRPPIGRHSLWVASRAGSFRRGTLPFAHLAHRRST